MKNDTQETKVVLWINRIVRWSFGGILLFYGLTNQDESRWVGIVIGTVVVITGFIRPKRCLEEKCSIDN